MAYKWKPLRRAYVDGAHPENAIQIAMDHYKVDRETAIQKLTDYDASCEYWRNDLYQVQTRRFFNESFQCDMMHINIRRIDGAAIFDWRHRQQIKTELVGAENEAFELYPAESRLVDTSNKYHLWAFVDPTVRLPVDIGQDARDVVAEEVQGPPGVRQRAV